MEIIQNRKTMKIISVLILMIMLISTITPVFAALSISEVNKNDKLKFTGTSWNIYSSKTAAQNKDKAKVNGYLKANQTITVNDKSGSVLQIGPNQFIRFSSSYFTKVTDTSKDNPTKDNPTKDNPTKDKTQQAAKKDFEIPDLNIDTSGIGTAIGQIGEGLISGIGKIGESGFLENIGQIIMDFINSLVESIRTISINLPTVDTGNLKDLFNVNEETLKLEIDGKTVNQGETITIKVGEKVKVKATVHGKEVKPTYTYADKKLKMTGNEIIGVSKGTGTLFDATYSYKDKVLKTNIIINIEETGVSTQGTGGNKTVAVTSVSISGANKVKVGETITLTATVKPSNATNKKVTWSSDSKAATVGKESGIVEGVTAGETVTITATTSNKITATYEVSVEAAQQGDGSKSTGAIKRTSVQPTGYDWKTYCKNMDANNGEWLGYIDGACKQYGVRRDTVMAMIYQESRGVNVGINSEGYCGLIQAHYDQPSDLEPKNNIYKGVKELAAHIEYWDGNERNGIQAYFSGDAGLERKIKNGGTYSYYNSVVNYRNEINRLYTFN